MSKKTAKRLISHLLAATVCFTGVPSAVLPVYAAEAGQDVSRADVSELHVWDFSSDAQGWEWNEGWSDVKENVTVGHEQVDGDGRLKLSFDNSSQSEEGWSKTAIHLPDMSNISYADAGRLSFDFYYCSQSMSKGDISLQIAAQAGDSYGSIVPEGEGTLQVTGSEGVTELEDGWKKKTCEFALTSTQDAAKSLIIAFVGQQTDYNGCVYFDNIKLLKAGSTDTPGNPGDGGSTENPGGGSDTENPGDGSGSTENPGGGIPQKWEFETGADGWTLRDGWSGATGEVSWDSDGQRLKVGLDYSGITGTWPGVGACYQAKEGLDFSAYNQMSMDLYYLASDAPDGISVGVSAQADNKDIFENNECSVTEGAVDAGNGWMKKTCKVKVNESAAAEARPSAMEIIFKVEDQAIKKDIYIDNITFQKAEAQAVKGQYDFTDGLDTWKSDSGWLSDGVTQDVSHDAAGGRLALDLDYRAVADKGWQNAGICTEADGGYRFEGYNKLSFDFYYNPSDMTKGTLILKPVAETDGNDNSQKIFQDQMNGIADSAVITTDAGDGFKKATFTFQLTEANTERVHPQKFSIVVMGNETDFAGTVYFDHIKLWKEELYVDSTVKVSSQTNLSTGADALTVNGSTYPYASAVKLVDGNANADTQKAYQYLKAVGESDAVVFGHMEDTVLKAGYAGLTNSDTKDVTGSLSAIDGLDCGNLFVGFKDKYENRYPGEMNWSGSETEQNIQAAAGFSNKSIEEGALMTLSAHMPNFAFAKRREGVQSEKTYDQFDYSTADSYKTDGGECMKNLLPGLKYNEAYTAYLDMVAEYAGLVNGTILFRPLHENTGGWFWWGNACTPETYKSVFKYTVEYLRDEKGVHNFIYVYGPGTEAGTEAEYEERYPGDGYVDMVGFDSYDSVPSADASYTFQEDLKRTIELTSSFAQKHNKLFAITETGIANGNIALLAKGNPRKDWYCEILELASKPEYNCCYFMLWSNYSSSAGYYTPYVVKQNADGSLYGHEMLDGFIRFYNDKRSIFADTQKTVLHASITPPSVSVADENALDGYFISPPEGSRLTEAVQITARLTKDTSEEVTFVLTGANGESVTLQAEKTQGRIYRAELTAQQLAEFTPEPDGLLALYAGGQKLQELGFIINIKEPVEDPLSVDDFESYLGRDSLLASKWQINKSSNSQLNVTLSDAVHSTEGKYAMKFAFTLKKGGYVGTEIAKTADWSGCNALRLWVKPDGKNQKTVIQVKIGNDAYEAYLNDYDDYKNAKQPLQVTLPFCTFVHKGNGSKLDSQAAAGLTGLGLWMNALDASFADADSTLEGVLYYDDIKAVTTDSTEPVFEIAAENDETQKPGDSTQKPGDSTQTPGGSTQNPGSTQAPGSSTQNPGNTQSPGSSTQNPGGSSTQSPGDSTQTPGGSTQSPGSSTQEPGSSGTQEPAGPGSTSETVKNQTVKAAKENTDGTFAGADGQVIKNAIVEAPDGNKYITDAQGKKRKSEFVDTADGTTYYVKETGIVAQKEMIQVAGAKYFAKETGAIAKNEFCTTPKGSIVYASKDGALVSDKVITVAGKKYYMKQNCALAKKGFFKTSYGNQVYARKNGELVTNKVFVSKGKRYFAKSSGAVAKSGFFFTASGNKVYAKASGELVANKLFTVAGAKYYAKKSGAVAVKQWVKAGKKQYYCSASGKITKVKK